MAYELDGIQYPSVTAITGILDKPALLGWAAREACDYVRENFDKACDPTDNHALDDVLEGARNAYKQRRDSAADSGKIAHKAIELYFSDSEEAGADYVSDNAEAGRAYSAFLDWVGKNEVVALHNECEVFSTLIGYAGRFDAILKVNGTKYLVDFKTSSGVYDEMRYQICAYRQAWNEMLNDGEESIENMAILHLDKKTGDHTFHDMSKDATRYTDLFNSLVRVYYLMKNRRLKNNQIVQGIKDMDKPIEIFPKNPAF